MRACEWGCRQWIKRGLQEKHMQKTCPRRIFPCKFKCGVSIRAEQWEVIGDRHYEHECARRLVPCPLECGGMYADEDVAEHKVIDAVWDVGDLRAANRLEKALVVVGCCR
jgi:hypothetical protein